MIGNYLDPPGVESDAAVQRDLFWILFPGGLEQRVIDILESVGVPGYSEGAPVVGRGPRGRHFNNPVWPGATGQIFTAVDCDQSHTLIMRLRAFDHTLQHESNGLSGVHVLTWPCQSIV